MTFGKKIGHLDQLNKVRTQPVPSTIKIDNYPASQGSNETIPATVRAINNP
ncbi:unnamed protein product [Acidithrix sp. C25]|nr:unnamed protein product [Acidithrix sp. C25]